MKYNSCMINRTNIRCERCGEIIGVCESKYFENIDDDISNDIMNEEYGGYRNGRYLCAACTDEYDREEEEEVNDEFSAEQC